MPIVGCRDGVEHLKVWFSPSTHQFRVLNYHVEEASAFLPDECDWFISPSLGCLMHFNMVENGHPFWTECSANHCLWIHFMENWIPKNSEQVGSSSAWKSHHLHGIPLWRHYFLNAPLLHWISHQTVNIADFKYFSQSKYIVLELTNGSSVIWVLVFYSTISPIFLPD